MKKLITLVCLLPMLALAGDDPVAQVAYTGTAGCSSALAAKRKYAVQCTTACYVKVNTSNSTNLPTASTDVYLEANRLYDLPTTSLQVYICAVQASSAGSLKIFLNRGPNE